MYSLKPNEKLIFAILKLYLHFLRKQPPPLVKIWLQASISTVHTSHYRFRQF